MRVPRSTRLAYGVASLGLLCLPLPLGTARADGPVPLRKIGEMELSLVGLSARVEPARPVVPKNVASGVRIVVVAGGQELAADEVTRLLGGAFQARAELLGPGLPGALELKTAAADPDPLLLPLPPLPVAGDYELANVRLVAPARTLDVASTVPVQVIDQILVTSVKTRALTLDEIKEKGIVLDSDDYLGFEFTLGLKFESKPIDFKFPVIFDREGVVVPDFIKPPPPPIREGVLTPTFLPILLEALGPEGEGGARERIPLTLPKGGGPIRIPSVVVIPGNVAFLKQFFSAQLFVANGAPGGSGLVVRNVVGKLKLPPGPDGVTAPPGASVDDLGDDPLSLPKVLRDGQTITQPSELPLRGLGPDAQPGTADDEDELPPAAQGQAEFLIRGEKEGFHIVDFDLTATLDGLAIGPVEVSGKAQGGLLVRNASFDMTFTVPGVVRTGERFKLFATLTNIGKGIGNQVEVALDGLGLAGVSLAPGEEDVKVIDTLLPGDAQTVEFLFDSEVTGQVVASYLDFDDKSAGGGPVTGRMRFTLGVGERGVPLSPDTLVLPAAVDDLVNPTTPLGQPSVVDAAMRVLGQAWSIANAPSGSLPKGVLRTSKAVVTQKALALAEAGLRVSLGQPREDAVRDLAFDFFGGAPLDPGFDQLLRQTEAGRSLVGVLGRELAPTAASLGLPAFEEQVARVAASGADFVTFAVGAGVANPFTASLEDGRARRTETAGAGLPPWAVPGAALLPLGEGEAPPLLGLVTAPNAPPYVLRLRGRDPGAADVAVTFPDGQGGFVRAVLFGLEVPAGGEALVVVDPARPAIVRLERDDDGDGTFVGSTVGTTALLLEGPSLVSARVIGPEVLAGASPLGNQVAILFDRVVDEKAAADVTRYGMVDNAMRVARRQLSGRLVFGALERPEGPYVPVRLAVDDMKDTRGSLGTGGEVDLLSLLVDPGAVVSGRVLTAEGEPVTPGRVVYTATSTPKGVFPCALPAGVAAVPLDANGRYEVRYVRQDPCGAFTMVTQDPGTGARSEVSGHVRAAGERIELDIVLFGRGSVTGQVRARASGQPIAGAKVTAVSVTDPQIGGATTTDAEGKYLVPGITVGPVSVRAAKGIAAGLGAGRIDRAGTTATVDVLLDTGSVKWSGVVRSKKGTADAVTLPGLQVVYYVDGTPVGVTRTDDQGAFAFSALPAGNTKVRAALNTSDTAEAVRVTAEGDVIAQDLLIVIPEDAELGTVRGVVRFPDGGRAGGIVVRAGNRGALTSKPQDGVPESGGEFVMTGLPLGETFVGAESPDGRRTGYARVTLSAAARDVATAITLSGLGTAVFTVVDPLGQPVEGAEVRLADCAEDPCGCTSSRTKADGTVEFANRKVGTVHAKAFSLAYDDVATGSASVTRDGDRGVGLLRLGGTGTLEGIVLDHRGLPALGADLEVLSRVFVNDGVSTCGMTPGISHRYRTGVNGTFRFASVSAGPVSVTASQAFYPTRVGQQVVLLHGRTEALTLRLVSTMAGVFTGLVYLPDGQTLAGRGVEVMADGPLPEVVVKTDDTGRFRFAKILPEGLYTVTVRDPVTGGVVRESVYLRANEPAERDFRLKGKGEVRVRVVDGADQPVESAYVRLREEEYPNRSFERALGPSNQGVAVIPNVFEGPVSLEASDSFARGGRASTVLPGPGRTVEATVRLTVTGRVTGRFRRPDGTPIPLGVVRLFVAGRPFGQITTSSATEDEGRFAFDYVPAGAVVLEAQDPLTARTGRATGSLASEGEVLEVDVFAQALGTVEGLVTSNDAPQPGALVEVTSGTFVATTDTDAFGRYRMQGVPGGRVVAKASLAQGFLAGTAAGDLTQDGAVLGLDVALRGSARVRGSVVAYDGSHPLSRVTIRSGGLGGAILATLTHDDGLFEIDRVPAGPAEIVADVLDSTDQAGRSVTVPEGGVLDVPPLELPGLGTVEVRVVDGLGQPVEAASVMVVGPNGGGRSGSLGGGVARFPQVPAGPITARAWDANQRAGLKTAVLAPGATLKVEVALNPTFTLSGQVKERTGEPAPAGVEVTLRGPSYAKTATLDEGLFSFPFVPVGAFQLEAQTAAGDRGHFAGVVLETGVAPVVLALNGVGPVEVELVDFAGLKVAEAQVQLSTQGSVPDLQYGKTGADGVATFPRVLRGPLSASAYARGTRALVTAPWQDGQPVQRLLAALPQQGRIEGKVLDPTGTTGVAGVTVLLGYASTASGLDGVFAFDNVPLGTHALNARVNGRLRAYRDGIAVTSIAPVRTGQDLVLIGAAKVKGRVKNSQGQFGSGATVTLKSPVARFGGTFTATTNGTGQYELADVPVGPFSLTATLGSERVDLVGLAMPDPAVDQEIPIQLIADLADLETYLYDGNAFRYQIRGDGSLAGLQGLSFLPGAPRLFVTRGGVASPFAGASDRYVPSEEGRRELLLREEGLAGLDVTRKVFVPNEGHFVRYLEVIENPTDSAVLLDEVSVETALNSGWYPTAGFVTTASGDATLDAADGWVVLDDKPGEAEDPDIFVNFWKFPPLAAVLADPTRPGAPTVSFSGGTLRSRYASVTVPAHGRVAFLHAYSVRATRTGAAASAARLFALPPELLQGLHRQEALAVRNFGIEVGPGPADGPTSGVPALPPNDGKVSGTVRASDHLTPLLLNGELRPRNPFLDRPVVLRSGSDGAFEARANLVAEAPPYKVLVPRGDYDLAFAQLSPAVLAATATASGTFAPGASASVRDVVFAQTGFVSGTVRRASGAAVPSARVVLKAAAGGTAEVLADGFGVFRFPVVPSGDYSLHAILPAGGATTPTVPVVVGTGVQPPVPLVFPAFGSISGTMRNHAGQGLTSCSAQIVVNATPRTTTCGAGGAYSFADVPPDTYVVGVRDHRSQVALSQTVQVAEGPATLVPDFVFPPVGTVKVTVRSQGSPLHLAQVYWTAPARGVTPIFAGYSGTNPAFPGQITIGGVPGSGILVEAVHPQSTHVRKASAPLEITFDGQEVATVIDLPAPVRLEGAFRTRDGRTVSAYQASAWSADGSTSYANAIVNASTFTLPNLPPLPLRLRGQALGTAWFVAEKEVDLTVASGTVMADAPLPWGRIAAAGGRDLWELEAEAGVSVNVRLLGEAEGAVPAPDVILQVVGPQGAVYAKGETPATKDANLNFTPPVAGTYVAIVSARGAQTGFYKLGSSSSLRVFREYAGGLVTGRVVRESDAPVVGLRVVLASLPGRPFATTGPDGGYVFPAVLAGPATVEAIDAEGVVIGTVSGEGALPDLVVPGRGTVTATATRLGIALSGLQVRFTSDHGTALPDDKARQRTTSAAGVATALLPVGLVRAEATDPVRGVVVTSEVKVLSEGGSVDLPLLFADTRTLVTGTVRNGDGGVPVPCGRVDLLLAGVLTRVAFCDSNGVFSLPLVAPGSYTLTARYGSFVSAPVNLSLPQGAATSVTVDLSLPMPVLRARVVEPPPSGASAPAQVRAVCSSFEQYLTPQPDGTHLYFGRPCGAQTSFTVTGTTTDGSALEVSQLATYETGFTGTRDVTLTLPPTGTVQVNVADTDGAGVSVRLTDSTGRVRTLYGDSGAFTFSRVPTGPANVVATDDYGVEDAAAGPVVAGETLVFDLALPAGNLELSLTEAGSPLYGFVFVEALDVPAAPFSRRVDIYSSDTPIRWRIPAGAFRVRYEGAYEYDEGGGFVYHPPAAFEGEVALGQTIPVALQAGSHVALPTTLGGFQAELGNWGPRDDPSSFVRTTVQGVEPFVSPAIPEHDGKGLRDLALVGQGLRMRRIRYVPESGAFLRTLTLIENRGAATTAYVQSLLAETTDPAGVEIVTSSSDDEEFDATDSWIVVRNGDHLLAAVFGVLPGARTAFEPGDCGDGCSPTWVRVDHPLEIASGEGETQTVALLAFALRQPGTTPEDVDAIVARARALGDLSFAGALADLSSTERDAIVNFVVPGFGALRGVVEDAGGARVPRARVFALRGELVAAEVEAEDGAGDPGAFAIADLPVGDYSLVAVHPATNRPGRGPAPVTVLEGGPQDAGVVTLLGDAQVGIVRVEGVLEGTTDAAEGASVRLEAEGFSPAWAPVQVLGMDGSAEFADVPAGVPLQVRGTGAWVAVPPQPAEAVGAASITVPIVLRYEQATSLPADLTAGGRRYFVQANGAVQVDDWAFHGTVAVADGQWFPDSPGVLRHGGREVEVGPATVGPVTVTRRVYVPPSGAFARFVDVIRNPTGDDLNLSYELQRYLWSGYSGDFEVFEKSGLAPEVGPDDDWLVVRAPGTPVFGVVLGGAGRPSRPVGATWSSSFGSASLAEAWWDPSPLVVPAGGLVVLVQFVVPGDSGSEVAVRDLAQSLSSLADPETALFGLLAEEKAAIVNFVVP